MRTINFEDQLVEYDETVGDSWTFQRGILAAQTNPAAFFGAMDTLFCGDADAVAARLGGSVSKMMELFEAISEQFGAEQKN